MTTRILVAVMAALLGIYLVLVGWRAVQLVATGEPVAIGMGIALVVLPVIAVWFVGREIIFGMSSTKLVRRLEAEEGPALADLPRLPSGRPERAASDAAFPARRADVEEHPDDWRAWLRLGLAYDASGDRRRARAAVRRAIQLDRASA